MRLRRTRWIFLLSALASIPAAAGTVFIDAETEGEWARQGASVWTALAGGNTVQFPCGTETLTAVSAGHADLMVGAVPAGMDIEAQRTPDYRNASGQQVDRFSGGLVDPLDGQGGHSAGGAFVAQPPPFDHDASLQPLGLKILSVNPSLPVRETLFFNRIGIRFNNTPPGRLLFLYEMSNEEEAGARWYANEFTVPIGGCPWRPGRDFYYRDHPETHLRKLVVLQLEPYDSPVIPAKLNRSGLTIDYTANSLSDATDHINSAATDANLPTNRPYVIQLPDGAAGEGLVAGDWLNWVQKLNQLTGGRKVWLTGQSETRLDYVMLQRCSNFGITFCRIGRAESASEKDRDITVSGPCRNVDFRNNWIECPDGVSDASIYVGAGGISGLTLMDSILSGAGAGISSQGGTVLRNSIFARNWIERGFDGVQMYGGWYNVVLAYNHFASASGFANREDGNGHWGAALHTDCFQSQSNITTQDVQKISIFCNFSQFGRHNWPARWYELGSGEQNIIVDSDAYEDSHIYWNIFQNLLPAGHRGIKTLSPDWDYARQQDDSASGNWIKNFTILGNAFLDRWDHSNRQPYGYRRAQSSVAGKNLPDYFELAAGMNFQGSLAFHYLPCWYSSYLEGRPDPAAMTGWKVGAPTLTDVYENPITYTGSWTNGYEADFSRTAHAAHKLLHGWCEPTDYAPVAGWETTPGGNPVLAPVSELLKVAPMPVDTAAFLGDASRSEHYFDELSSTAFAAVPLIGTNLWSAGSSDDGFLLHIKFGSVGTLGTHRELLSETEGSLRYEVALTSDNTVRYRLTDGGAVLSEVESVDMFSDGDHLTMQVYTPFHSIYVENGYVVNLLNRLYNEGMTRIRYWFSASPPPVNPEEIPGVLNVWMNMADHYHFYHFENGQWKKNLTELTGMHSCALRTFSPNRAFSFNGSVSSSGMGSAENFRRDVYPVTTAQWHTLYLDGPDEDYTSEWGNNDILWLWDGDEKPAMMLNVNGTLTGAASWFNLGGFSSGRPRCFIRRNLDHQDKAPGWVWSPDQDLPRGNVVLFNGFEGTCESVRVIRGGQGQYGAPANPPAYRSLDTVGAAMSFIRPALNQQGQVPGWGSPDLYLHGGATGNAGRGGELEAYTPPSNNDGMELTNMVTAADRAWSSDGSSDAVGEPTVCIGTITSPVIRSLVMPFWIPDLEGRQILGAELRMSLSEEVPAGVTGLAHVDLYGVRSDDSSPATAFADTMAGTLLVDDWFAIETGLELEQKTANAALGSWVSGQVGTTGEKYVFLSVKPDAPGAGSQYACFHTGDAAVTNARPFLVLTLSMLAASFGAVPVAGDSPLTVTLTDLSSGGVITNRTWDFGDGTVVGAAPASVMHTYTEAGSYTVSLTVSGPGGSDTETKTGLIAVTESQVTNTVVEVLGHASDRRWSGEPSAVAVGEWVGQPTARTGSGSLPQLYKYVIPFQLPDIGDEIVSEVELSAYLVSSYQHGNTDVYIDVYAGRTSLDPATEAGDWEIGCRAGDNIGRIASVETVDELKTVELNASCFQNMYDSDPQAAGKYLFLVLAPDAPLDNSYAYCTWATADSTSYDKPQLSFITVSSGSPVDPPPPSMIDFDIGSFGSGSDVINWTTVQGSGYIYSVWFSTNLTEAFLPLQTNLADTAQSMTNTINAPAVFYQIRAQ